MCSESKLEQDFDPGLIKLRNGEDFQEFEGNVVAVNKEGRFGYVCSDSWGKKEVIERKIWQYLLGTIISNHQI